MHVLIVDDSAVVRQTVTAILSTEPDISSAVASDPIIAMQKMTVRRPDVIVLDIEMPRMDGLTFLRKIMVEDPIPVVICSAMTGPQTAPALRALQEGAVDVVAKPTIGVRDFLTQSSVELIDTVRAAGQARLHRPATAVRPPAPLASSEPTSVIAIGASTGGTQAIRHILMNLPADAPPVLIVQHMPGHFTRHFAKSLDDCSAMKVSEASDGDRIERGRALIAPGGRHMVVASDSRGAFVRLDDGPPVSRHRPSVDVLFRSLAEQAGSRVIGALLTGMGADGADGLLQLRKSGAMTIAQDESSSVVFGMPREAIMRGAADRVLPLSGIPAALTTGRR